MAEQLRQHSYPPNIDPVKSAHKPLLDERRPQGCSDANTDLLTLDIQDSDSDVVTDLDGFVDVA